MKRNILTIAVAVISCTLYAQTDSLRTVVNVNNEYNPVHIKVNKKNFTPTISSQGNVTAPEYKFTTDAIPYYGFVSERNTKEMLPGQENLDNGYLRLGYGLTNEIDAKATYGIDLTGRDNLKVSASMKGFNDELKGLHNNWDSRMYHTGAGIGYTHAFNKLLLGVDGNFNNRVFNYQSAGFSQFVTDKQNIKNYSTRFRGVSTGSNQLGYNFNAGFNHNTRKYSTGLQESIAENSINAGAGIYYNVDTKEVKRVGIQAGADMYLYNKNLRDATFGYTDYCSINVDPYIDFDFSGWELHLGTTMNFITAGNAVFAIAPDIKLRKSFNNNVTFFAKATGRRTDNSFTKLDGRTPYWGFDKEVSKQLKPTYKILDAAVGSTITFEPLSIDAAAGYSYTKDDVIQVLDYLESNSQDAYIFSNFVQENMHNVFVSARLGYDYGGWLKASADARYDYWGCKDRNLLILKPIVTVNVNAEVKPLRNLTVNAGYNFTRYTKIENGSRTANKNDLNLRISYNIKSWLGVYIQGNNLLNNRYYEHAGYATRGARGLIGVTANF